MFFALKPPLDGGGWGWRNLIRLFFPYAFIYFGKSFKQHLPEGLRTSQAQLLFLVLSSTKRLISGLLRASGIANSKAITQRGLFGFILDTYILP